MDTSTPKKQKKQFSKKSNRPKYKRPLSPRVLGMNTIIKNLKKQANYNSNSIRLLIENIHQIGWGEIENYYCMIGHSENFYFLQGKSRKTLETKTKEMLIKILRLDPLEDARYIEEEKLRDIKYAIYESIKKCTLYGEEKYYEKIFNEFLKKFELTSKELEDFDWELLGNYEIKGDESISIKFHTSCWTYDAHVNFMFLGKEYKFKVSHIKESEVNRV